MMDVPIEYTNTMPCFASGSGSNCYVIEKTESCWLLALSMVPWRPNNTIASVDRRLLVKYLAEPKKRCLRRQQRSLITSLGVVNIVVSICLGLILLNPIALSLYLLSIFVSMAQRNCLFNLFGQGRIF